MTRDAPKQKPLVFWDPHRYNTLMKKQSLLLSFCLFLTGTYGAQATTRKPFSPEECTIAQIQEGYRQGAWTAMEVVNAFLGRIQEIDSSGPALNSVICLNPKAQEQARLCDAARKEGHWLGPLHGVPIPTKANTDTADAMPTTAGSRALAHNMAQEDAFLVARLRQADAIILGKTNLSEWANFRASFSSSGWSGQGGQTRNPYILDRNPCGSSSGSGVAAAASLCAVAIGTETNGSIVCPANNNGVVGIKPTLGLVSRTGIIPIAASQDTAGPMARTLRDAVCVLNVLAAADPRDPAAQKRPASLPTDYLPFLEQSSLKGKRLGRLKALEGYHPRVDRLMEETTLRLRQAGAEVVDISDPLPEGMDDASFEVLLTEFKEGLNRYLARRSKDCLIHSLEDLKAFNEKDPVELRFFDQALVLQALERGGLDDPGYQKSLAQMLTLARREGIDHLLSHYHLDALIAPTGAPAWVTDPVNGDHFMGGSSSLAAIAGTPHITLPMGMIDGLPVGLSLMGAAWSEGPLIGIAAGVEQTLKARRPPLYLPTLNLPPQP